jgi:hypothetical protein
MYYKSFIHDYTNMLTGLLAGLGLVVLSVACHGGKNRRDSLSRASGSSALFVSCTDDSTRYVHDSRTFGIWYNRGRFDTALHFPLLADTIQCTTQTAPQLFSIGPNSLWWFDGQLNHRIGGGGTVTAANGLDIDAGSVILGYSQVTNLYRAVATITGNTFYGINDFDSLQAGTDNIIGPFAFWSPVQNVNEPYLSVGPFFAAGWKDPFTGLNTLIESDSTQVGIAINNVDGSYTTNYLYPSGILISQASISGQANTIKLDSIIGSTMTVYNMAGYPVSNLIMNYLGATLSANKPTGSVINQVHVDTSGITGITKEDFHGNTNGFKFDTLYSAYFARINASFDSIIGIAPRSPTIVFDGALSVNTSNVSGDDAAFDVTFTTGTVGVFTDTTVFTVTYAHPAHSVFSVVPFASSTALSAVALQNLIPYTCILSNQTFSLCGGRTGGMSGAFANNTTYTFSFITIDHEIGQIH